jgi:DNA-binding transcriptional MerR regulator
MGSIREMASISGRASMTSAAARRPDESASAQRPSVPAGSTSARAGLISIGEVLAQLREDFPDVTISKLRFLEAEGLVEPQRTSAGYRKYGPSDVERLRYVLAAQRDRFLPLRVIRDQLAAIDRGQTSPSRTASPPVPDPRSDPAPVPVTGEAMRPVDAGRPTRYRRADVLRESGLADAMLTELEATGLLGTRTPGWYEADALIVAKIAGAFHRLGLAPRHLRAYRAGADREVGLFAQLLAPLQRSTTASGQARAAELMDELTALSQELHAALVRIGLRDTLGH